VQASLYDGETLRQALKSAERFFETRVDEVNAINVFPVPDGDTGINMYLTLQAANEAAAAVSSKSAAEVSSKAAWGALMGARGNSGVILSQIFRGLAKGLEMKERFSSYEFADALRSASDSAYKALSKPVEGTILTVIREAQEAAMKRAEQGANLHQTMTAVVSRARSTVKRTPELLPALREAHVVDAGAQGLMYMFQGMKEFTSARIARAKKRTSRIRGAKVSGNGHSYGFDLQFMVEGKALKPEAMRDKIWNMGESVLVVGDERLVRVHVHTPDPQAVMDYCSAHGKLKDVNIEDMDKQAAAFKSARKTRAKATTKA